MAEDTFNALATELRDLASAVIERQALSGPDLRRVLTFIAKVSQVVEQAYQDLVPVLVEIKYLNPADLVPERISGLQKQIELLTVRSRYRDAEEICSRLHHLSDQYSEQIRPLVEGGGRSLRHWHHLWNLLDEHEGLFIQLMHRIAWELRARLERVDSASLRDARAFASHQLASLRNALDVLRDLANQILGVSGAEGLLELTADGRLQDATTLVLNQGGIRMSNDTYKVGQAAAVGPGAMAENNTFMQLWAANSSGIDVGQLAQELATLRGSLAAHASTADHYVAIGEVAAAENAAQTGDGPGALRHLKSAGLWVWDVATKIGIGVATAAAKGALGL